MIADSRNFPQGTGSSPSPPRLTRRSALLGATALLGALPLRHALADDPVAGQGVTPDDDVLLLNGNENPYGPAASARAAVLRHMDGVPRYAEAAIERLRLQIAAREAVPPAQVMIGSGSGELLRVVALRAAVAAAGSELVASRPTYEELPEFAALLGLQVRWTPARDHRHDLDAMRRAVTERTRLVYVCNPNNPTGTAVASAALEAFVRSMPASLTVVVDEAYVDFIDAVGVGSVAGLTRAVPNLAVLRTFSKLHGLAGLRVGYAIASPALAQDLARFALVWPNSLGLAAAGASFDDLGFQAGTRTAILADRARVHDAIDRLGLARTDSQGNFVFFDTGMSLQRFQDAMLARGIRVGRRFDAYERWARVTIGRRAEVDRFLAALPGALQA
ncbi:MAG: pyridoxal phosphate-dependent aminotransferase [Steroidobacteraceae bacterium]